MKRGGKAAVLAGLLCLGGILATGAVFQERIIEEWKLHQLLSGDERARRAALIWLKERATLRAVPALLDAVASAPEGRRHQDAEAALVEICFAKRTEAVPLLAFRLKDTDPRVRRFAAWCLGILTPEAAAVIPDLVRACADPDDVVRYWASFALQSIGEPAVSPLLGALAGPDPALRAHAAWLLGTMGSRARKAAPLLREAASDADALVRAEAAAALRRIGDEP